ncbi:MAG: hypothetical protein JSU96_16440 [Acidobacteriota bacterium]|nr:MAG: hypothetical protein JSU96_16440 [Acidobacteriota bacterium]
MLTGLNVAAGLIPEDSFEELVEQLSATFFPLFEDFEASLKVAESPLMSALAERVGDEGFSGRFGGLFDASLSLRLNLAREVANLTGFVFEAGILSEGDYERRRGSVLGSLADLGEAIQSYLADLEAMRDDLEGQGLLDATVLVETLEVAIGGVRVTSISQLPATLTVRAVITNASDQSVSGLSTALAVPGQGPDVSYSAESQALSPLAAGASRQVDWTVTFRGPETLSHVLLQVQLRSADGSVYIPGFAETVLPILLEADRDGDLLSDDYETNRGLNPDRADSDEDSDGDGLDNLTESILGTDPKSADSDGDGFDDGVEVEQESDPLLGDSTPEPALPGDLNRDGEVGLRDLVMMLRYLQGAGLGPSPLSRADLNADGVVNMADAVLLTRQLTE